MSALAVWFGIGCLLLLSLVVLISIAVVMYHHERECLYDINMPCYTDWVCSSEDGKTTEPVYDTKFKAFYNACLGDKKGTCVPPSSSLNLGASSNQEGCKETNDYIPNLNRNVNPYSKTAYNQPYPLSDAEPIKKYNDNRNICSNVPTVIN